MEAPDRRPVIVPPRGARGWLADRPATARAGLPVGRAYRWCAPRPKPRAQTAAERRRNGL